MSPPAAAAPPAPAELELLGRARELAARGAGLAAPNPPVGAVVVSGGRVVGEGWHRGPGTPHAEAMALAEAGAAARGATVVCTLEPCSHHGRTPPCADALVAAGVARVVIGALDPLERGRAQGRRVLAEAGVEVAVAAGEEARRCADLVAPFLTWAVTGRPLVTLKLATSLDGRVATASGESRWISSPESRSLVHRWRAEHDAVAIGIGTAIADDPLLTARDVDLPFAPPRRVVFDSSARLPPAGALARDAASGPPVLVAAAADAPAARVAGLEAAGVEVLRLPGDPAARLAAALDALGAREVQSVMVEGGAGLAGALVAAGLVDRVAWFVAPVLIGGRAAPSALGDPGARALAEAPRLREVEVARSGPDTLVTGWLRPRAWEG